MEIIYTAVGLNGTIDLEQDALVIKRGGLFSFLTQGFASDKRILISTVTSVQYREPGFANGYIQFSYTGGIEAKSNWASNENTVMFQKGDQVTQFRKLRDLIETKMKELQEDRAAGRSQGSLADEIEKLASLRQRGLLTDEEFEQQKKKLLT